MATLSTTVRNSHVDSLNADIAAGSGAGKFRLLDGATVLAQITLDDPSPFGAGSVGVATLASVPLSDTSADAEGTADGWDIVDSDDNVLLSGNLTTDGTIDNTSVKVGQQINLTAFTYTQPATG